MSTATNARHMEMECHILDKSSMPTTPEAERESGPQNPREYLLLRLFRQMTDQQQRDVLRVSEAFAQLNP